MSVDETDLSPTMAMGTFSCPGQGMFFFEAVPKGVLPMSATTAATDSATWHSQWDAAYLADHEVGGTPSALNDETLLSYYTQGSISQTDSVAF